MIFKVFYQESFDQVPVRERTKSLYIEANTISEVRKKLADRQYNIEFITELSDAMLEYEQQLEDYELENV
ncbi:DNA-dependent RNA polymerase subunit epsilon [Anaerobacillus sp. MEB173]|uniref:DNA-dependent RNA polymerase subunit epsilon n=1 Tax=Anaerobacillus sp. MEB173 TaxID=3383345 RepID=UPI003F90DB1D